MSAPPDRPASSGGAPAGMPARLWEAAKHNTRGTIPPWVRAAPDASASAPSHIGQIGRRAAQAAAVAGAIGGGIGLGIGLTEGLSHSAESANAGDGSPAAEHLTTEHVSAEHVITDHVGGSLTSSVSGDAPGPPGSASEGVTLHTSGEGGHVLHTTWRIPGHAGTGEHEQHGAGVEHDGLTIEIYQDVEVSQGADGTYSVDAVEYVVVRDEHGHDYVFSDNYHTVVPDPPGQETDLVIHETDHVQVTEHPDGSFSVAHPDNSISVTVGADGDGGNEVTVTQSETVQINHDHPGANADGHDTSSLTEIEDGGTTSNQTEVVSADAPLPPGQEPADPSSVHGPDSSGTFSGPHGGLSGPGGSAAPASHFPGGPVPAQHPAGGSFESASSSAVSKPFEHPAPEPPADAASPDSHQSATLTGHDQPGLDEPAVHTGSDLAAAEPADAGLSTDPHGAGEYEAASTTHPDSLVGAADAPEHDPGTAILH